MWPAQAVGCTSTLTATPGHTDPLDRGQWRFLQADSPLGAQKETVEQKLINQREKEAYHHHPTASQVSASSFSEARDGGRGGG